jgi:hypothetical protein
VVIGMEVPLALLGADREPLDLSGAEGHYGDALALAEAPGCVPFSPVATPAWAACIDAQGRSTARGASSTWPATCTGPGHDRLAGASGFRTSRCSTIL